MTVVRPRYAGLLVERGDELSELVGALVHTPAVALVEGEPGIGKTRLVHEALTHRHLPSRQMLVAGAHPVRDPFPLGPLVDALRQAKLPTAHSLSPLIGALRPILPERANELPKALEPLDDPGSDRHRVIRAIVELLGALGPTVLVLEDLHWVDDRTLDVLALLGDQPPTDLAVVLTYRGTDVTADAPLHTMLAGLPSQLVRARIALRPLSRHGVGVLAADVLGQPVVPDKFARYLNDATGGVPFIIEQAVRLLLDQGVVPQTDEQWNQCQLSVPAAVGAAVAERAARLSQDARTVLDVAAVVAVPTDVALLGTLTGFHPDSLTAALGETLRVGLLDECGTQLAFHHALGRQAVYETIPGPRRRQLHLAVARASETTGGEATLGERAHHYREAGALDHWARCAEQAAKVATSVGERATAYWYVRDLLDAGAVENERRAGLTVTLARAAYACPAENKNTFALIREALAIRDMTAVARGELRALLGTLRAEDPDDAVASRADLKASIDDLDELPGLQARVLTALAIPVFSWDDALDDHFAYLHAARTAATRSADREVQAAVTANDAFMLMNVGDPRAWQAFEALPSPDASLQVNRHIVRGLANVADAALNLGHYQQAREIAARGQRLAGDLHIETYDFAFSSVDLRACWAAGQINDVEEYAYRLRDDPRRRLAIDGDQLLGEILINRGALKEAGAVFSAITERARALGNVQAAVCASAGTVRIALARHDLGTAHKAAEHFLSAVAAKRIWVWAAPLLPFAPLDLVRDVRARYREGIADRSSPFAHAVAAFTDGRIAEQDRDLTTAIAAFASARALFTALPNPRMAAHAAIAEGQCRTAAADPSGAELLRDAWNTFVRLDAPWEANRVKQLMRQAGMPVPHRRGRRGYGDQLSPRERDIVVHAAAGQSNREIGDRLYISERTVEYHLGNAMRKLDVRSRRELPSIPESESGD